MLTAARFHHHVEKAHNALGMVQSVIIKRNQPLPTKGGREYTTIADNQMKVPPPSPPPTSSGLLHKLSTWTNLPQSMHQEGLGPCGCRALEPCTDLQGPQYEKGGGGGILTLSSERQSWPALWRGTGHATGLMCSALRLLHSTLWLST